MHPLPGHVGDNRSEVAQQRRAKNFGRAGSRIDHFYKGISRNRQANNCGEKADGGYPLKPSWGSGSVSLDSALRFTPAMEPGYTRQFDELREIELGGI